MALSVWQKVITSNTGVAVPSASVEVFIGDTLTHATLFSDVDGTTPLSNPFTADSNGFAQFYVTGGTYRIEASAEGADAVHSFVQLGTAQSLDIEDVVGPGDLATVATTGDHADLLNKGTNTHAQIDTHIADAGKHREINDAATGSTDLWSASKISTELATKLESVDWGDIGGTLSSQTDLDTALGLKANSADLATVATSGDHTDLSNIGTNTHAQIDTHIATETAGIHGSTVAATAGKLVHRDGSGRAQVADPSASADIATKNYVDTTVAAGVSGTVSTGSTIDGDGSGGDPLDVADNAITYAKCASIVQYYLRPDHFFTYINSDQSGLAGAQSNVAIFDTANLTTVKTARPTISAGVVTVPENGVWEIKVVFEGEISTPNGDATIQIRQDPGGTPVELAKVIIPDDTADNVNKTLIVHHNFTSNRTFDVTYSCPTGATSQFLEGCSLALTWVGEDL